MGRNKPGDPTDGKVLTNNHGGKNNNNNNNNMAVGILHNTKFMLFVNFMRLANSKEIFKRFPVSHECF